MKSRDRMKRLTLALSIAIILSLLVGGCFSDGSSTPAPVAVKEIKIAYDPNKAVLFEDLVNTYNARADIKVRAIKMEIPDIIDAVAEGGLVAVSVDSTIWLKNIDDAWQDSHPDANSVVGTNVRFASTPVMIATWQGREGELGKEGQRGWTSLLQRASQDQNYHWTHGSPKASASGMLALVAEFYAATKKDIGLNKTDIDRQDVRENVSKLEKTISRYGGDSDAALVDYLLKSGQHALAATVLPEASVFDYNRRTKGAKLAAVAPSEGSLMLDHPLVLLESADLLPQQRRAFLDFGRFLTSEEGQKIVVKHGYRPVDLSYDMAQSPLKTQGISPEQPKLLQMPPTGVLSYARSAWATGLKRRANIILVADISGSMEGEKLNSAKEALKSFIRQVPSDDERVSLVAFSDDYQELVPLGRLGDNRRQIMDEIDSLSAKGNTAFFYSVWRAYHTLALLKDTERINVVVAMTDGRENRSVNYSNRRVEGITIPKLIGDTVDIKYLVAALKKENANILVFNVAYGGDADFSLLNDLGSEFNGQAYTAETKTIRRLYELISQNF
jgi:Ca-activated chloride channel family protein